MLLGKAHSVGDAPSPGNRNRAGGAYTREDHASIVVR